MKNRYFIYLLAIIFYFSSPISLNAQKNTKKKVTDSSKIIHRNDKFPCVSKTKTIVKTASPLGWYNFNAQIRASFSYVDSADKVTSFTDYTFYIDDSSYFAGLKESYLQKGKMKSYLRIAELKDSLEFKLNLSDSIKTYSYKNLRDCNGTGSRFRMVFENRSKHYIPTGLTKMIHGFLCEEYVFEDRQVKNTLWVSEEHANLWLDKVRDDLMYSLYYELVSFPRGIVFKFDCYDKQTRNWEKFEVLEISKNIPVRINTKGMKLKVGL